ncbi:hypothetical protein AB0F93_00165 [Micromonospora tulbaghiae]|uniref:hypothetical protein n=1 Tax=Micromonospora tulbaghiae TaxID=479978 RepID=UPI003329FC79
MTEEPARLPIDVRPADLPPGVAAIICSPVAPDEIRPGESLAEAMVRLGRAVVIRE